MRIAQNGISYHIAEHGDGKQAVVFLHYFGGSAASWRAVAALLPDWRCLAIDLHGFGKTALVGEAYTIDQHAQDVEALIAELGVASYTLVGHSMGGKIALALAARQPDGLERLVLVAPSPATARQQSAAEQRKMLKTYGDREAITAMLRGLGPADLPAAVLEQAVDENLATDRAAWEQWVAEENTSDISAQVGSITVPVVVLIGDGDTVFAPADMLSDLTPHLTGTQARVRTIEGAGHLLPYERPADIAAAIRGE